MIDQLIMKTSGIQIFSSEDEPVNRHQLFLNSFSQNINMTCYWSDQLFRKTTDIFSYIINKCLNTAVKLSFELISACKATEAVEFVTSVTPRKAG